MVGVGVVSILRIEIEYRSSCSRVTLRVIHRERNCITQTHLVCWVSSETDECRKIRVIDCLDLKRKRVLHFCLCQSILRHILLKHLVILLHQDRQRCRNRLAVINSVFKYLILVPVQQFLSLVVHNDHLHRFVISHRHKVVAYWSSLHGVIFIR